MAARRQETLWSHFPRQQRKRESSKEEKTREAAAALTRGTDGSPLSSSGAVTPTDNADEAMERECGEAISINQIMDDISHTVVITPERPLKRSKLIGLAYHQRYSPRTASTLLHGKKEVRFPIQRP